MCCPAYWVGPPSLDKADRADDEQGAQDKGSATPHATDIRAPNRARSEEAIALPIADAGKASLRKSCVTGPDVALPRLLE